MSQRMDRIQNEVTSIRSDLKEQIDWAVQEVKTELRTELAAMINQKVVSLEARVEAKVNEVRQDTTSLLEELKTNVVAVQESQEKMGQAMERMSNELQELVQRDASIEGEEGTNPLLATTNWMKIYQLLAQHPHWNNPSFLHLLHGLLESRNQKRKKPMWRTLLPLDFLPEDMEWVWRLVDQADA